MADTGYTLPVFAVAAAKAALLHLSHQERSPRSITLDLLPGSATIPIEQVAQLDEHTALAICRSAPGDNLDLTRHTPVWAWVQWSDRPNDSAHLSNPADSSSSPDAETSDVLDPDPVLHLEAGEGVGRTAEGIAAIYRYARHLFDANLRPIIPSDRRLTVRLILPEGADLARRTSNAAFGILEGLALLGTSGIAQPLSRADHLDSFRETLRETAQTQSHLVFCIGQNGLRVARQLGIPQAMQIQTGNWIGAMLVEAGLLSVQSVLLLGYHGKLVKLASGIFNTSSHVADGRLEGLAAIAAQVLPRDRLSLVPEILSAPTADAVQIYLSEQGVMEIIFSALADRIRQRASAYVEKYSDRTLAIGTILFDRQGTILHRDTAAQAILDKISAS